MCAVDKSIYIKILKLSHVFSQCTHIHKPGSGECQIKKVSLLKPQ